MNDDSPVARLPQVAVLWDAEKQVASLSFDPEDFKTWGMVVAVLQMGIDAAKDQERMQKMVAAQAAMQEQQRLARLQHQLQSGR